MTQAEKQAVLGKQTVAYHSSQGGIEIKEILYGIEDYVAYVRGAWNGKGSVHKAKLHYETKVPYFISNGIRVPLDECIRS